MKIIDLQTTEGSTWEKEWRKSLPGYSEAKWLEIFPEAKADIPSMIAEWEEKRSALFEKIMKKRMKIKELDLDDFSQWFWREWIKITDVEKLMQMERQLLRLKCLLAVVHGKKPKERLTEEQIQQALAIPIESLINQPLRRSGRSLVGLCPLPSHNEQTPSFHIYPESNSFYCFGCGKGGNTINLTRLLYGFSFTEAVGHLIGK